MCLWSLYDVGSFVRGLVFAATYTSELHMRFRFHAHSKCQLCRGISCDDCVMGYCLQAVNRFLQEGDDANENVDGETPLFAAVTALIKSNQENGTDSDKNVDVLRAEVSHLKP